MMGVLLRICLLFLLACFSSFAFVPHATKGNVARSSLQPSRQSTQPNDDDNLLPPQTKGMDSSLKGLVTARLPTSVEDQVRQCVQSIQLASAREDSSSNSERITRHNIRLLLPLIGATDLDDWPGGSRQMMQAASPLVESILRGLGITVNNVQKVCLDASDGVYAWLGQAEEAKNDCAFVLLPTAESVMAIKNTLEDQVGPKRNLVIINPQWRRRSDFGGVFVDETSACYVEGYQPTFSLTNLICEGESIRLLHTHGSGWRVFVRNESLDSGNVEWALVGEKPFVTKKPQDWQQLPGNNKDGGRLFDYGQPSYQDIYDMLINSPNYTVKSPAERAAAAFMFIKDTL